MRTGGEVMPRTSPYKIELTKEEFDELNKIASKYTLPYFMVVRAKMILLAAKGFGNGEIASKLNSRREVVSRWRKKFFKKRIQGLEEGDRSGRPRAFPPRVDFRS
jgi:hypothetical protein